jgi:hypothetical protein
MLTQFMKNFKFRKILYFLTLIFELVYMTYWKGVFLWKEIDETYILIIGLITAI